MGGSNSALLELASTPLLLDDFSMLQRHELYNS